MLTDKCLNPMKHTNPVNGKLLLLLTLLSIFLSCSEKRNTNSDRLQTWRLDIEHADTLLRHSIDSIHYILLDGTEKSFIFNANKITVKNGLIYLGDFRSSKIVAYDPKGAFRFAIDQKGQGPEEYQEIKSFAVDEQNIYAIDNGRHKLYVFNAQNGAYKQSLALPFIPDDIEILPDGNLIFAYIPFKEGRLNLEQTRHKIFITDKELNIKKRWFEYQEGDYEFIGKRTYFTSADQGIVYSSHSSDDLFLFTSADSLKRIKVEFSKPIPEKYRKDLDAINEGNYNYASATPILCGNYAHFLVAHEGYIYDYLYDIPRRKLSTNDRINAYKGLWAPSTAHGNQLVSYLDNYNIYQELVDYGFEKNDKAAQHLKNENTILIVYTMK